MDQQRPKGITKRLKSFFIRDIIATDDDHERQEKNCTLDIEDTNEASSKERTADSQISVIHNLGNISALNEPCKTTNDNEAFDEEDDENDSNSSATEQFSEHPEPKRKYPRERTTFTAAQLKFLEELFNIKKYLTLIERSKVANHLELSEKQVKTWFQNRRTKYRRQKQGLTHNAISHSPIGVIAHNAVLCQDMMQGFPEGWKIPPMSCFPSSKIEYPSNKFDYHYQTSEFRRKPEVDTDMTLHYPRTCHPCTHIPHIR